MRVSKNLPYCSNYPNRLPTLDAPVAFQERLTGPAQRGPTEDEKEERARDQARALEGVNFDFVGFAVEIGEAVGVNVFGSGKERCLEVNEVVE